MIELRPFQKRACINVSREFEQWRSVLLVSATGSGKTVMGTALVVSRWRRSARVLFCAHRRELIMQSAAKLRESVLGSSTVGVIMPGQPATPSRMVQVGSIQTMLAQGFPPNIDFLVLDEAHHYNADEWKRVCDAYPKAKVLGLTATPVRLDGRPLGDVFERMVVAVQHSELLADGYLVPCRVYQPDRGMGSNEVAQDPLTAYQLLAGGARAFGFASRVEQCFELARRFTEAGIRSEVIEANTSKAERDSNLSQFRAGAIKVLWNVYALTEGVDVPEAACVIIGRRMDHIMMYLQACGRVLRPAPGKSEAIIIDLSGATLKHGFPTEDREYSLEGKAIRRTSPEQLRVCPKCGATSPLWTTACPECGFVPPVVAAPELKIYDHKLREVFAGVATPEDAKRREYERLRNEGRARGWNLYAVQKEYAKLFGEKPMITDASHDERRKAFDDLEARRLERGYKPGWSAVQFKNTFGIWPGKDLTG